MAGDVGQPGAKGKAVNLGPTLPARIGNRMQEMQDHAGILAHRARDVADHHKVRPADAGLAVVQRHDLAAMAQGGADGGAGVDARTVGRGLQATRLQRGDRQRQARQHAFGLGHLLNRHLFEIERFQPLFGGLRGGGVNLDLRVGLVEAFGHGRRFRAGVPQERLGRALFPRLCTAVFLRAFDLRQHEGHHMFQELRVAPEEAKALVEDRPLFGAGDKDGVKRPVEILTLGKAGCRDGADGIGHAPRADRQPGAAQSAGEMGDVFGQTALIWRGRDHARAPGVSHPRTPVEYFGQDERRKVTPAPS